MRMSHFNWNLNMQWLGIGLGNYTLKFAVPTTLLIIAGISSGFHILRQIRCISSGFSTWMKSFYNKNQYLDPIPDKYPIDPRLKQTVPNGGPASDDFSKNAYAVIYGANTKAGHAFSLYLMEYGYNLILIDRDAESIQKLED